MKQRISDLLDGLEFQDIEMAVNPETPVNHIKARTMRKVRAANRLRKQPRWRRMTRLGRATACIVLILLIGTATACAASPTFRNTILSLFKLSATDTGELSSENTETFTMVEGMDGVSIHSIPVDLEDWSEFLNGVLISTEAPYYQVVTEDYQLEALPTETVEQTVEWRGRSLYLHFIYTPAQGGLPTIPLEEGIECGYGYTNEDADAILMWLSVEENESIDLPAIYHLDTGELTDLAAKIDVTELPENGYGSIALRNDFLYITNSSYSDFFYRASLETGAVEEVAAPETGTCTILNETIYWMGLNRTLYQLTDDGQWEVLVSGLSNLEWSAGDGLLIGETEDQNVAVVDLFNNTIYELPALELGGYTALRHSNGDLIALTRTLGTNGLGIHQLGIISPDDRQLYLLDRESGTYDDVCGWLDENRFAILCQKDRQYYLCLYEFE